MLNVAEVIPSGIVMGAGTVTKTLLLVRVIGTSFAGAIPLRVTVPL